MSETCFYEPREKVARMADAVMRLLLKPSTSHPAGPLRHHCVALAQEISNLRAEVAALKAKLDEPWQRKAAAWLRGYASTMALSNRRDMVLGLARRVEAEAAKENNDE